MPQIATSTVFDDDNDDVRSENRYLTLPDALSHISMDMGNCKPNRLVSILEGRSARMTHTHKYNSEQGNRSLLSR